MRSFISEDDIEKAFVNQLVEHNGWSHLICDASPDAKDEPGPTGRESTRETILPKVLHEALLRLGRAID